MRFKDIKALDELLQQPNLAKTTWILMRRLNMRYAAAKQLMENALFSCHEVDIEELYNHFSNCEVTDREFDRVENHIKCCIDCKKRYKKEFEWFARNNEAYFKLIRHLYGIKGSN